MKKKVLIAATSVALIATLAIGTTLALLRDTTEVVTNTFTSDKSISISLREPKWDGYVFETGEIPSEEKPSIPVKNIADSNYPLGKEAASDDSKLGHYIAHSYMPGDTIPKNPIVKNTSKDEDEYLAVTVECFDTTSGTGVSKSYDDFKTDFGSISFNSDWTNIGKIGNKMIYLYGTDKVATLLTQGTVTNTSVFKEVQLTDTIGEEDDKLPTFEIKIQAYAIQAKNVEADEAKEKLLVFINK